MCWENTSGIWQSDRLTPTYAKPYANSPAICVEICRAVKMERRRNGVNKGFANDYERLYKAGISNPDDETLRQVKDVENPCLADFGKRQKRTSHIKCTSFDVRIHTEPQNCIMNRQNGQSHIGIAH